MVDPSFFDAVRLPSTVLLALDNRTFHFAVQPWHYLLRMAHILSTAAFFGGIVLFDLRLIGVRSSAKLKAFSADIMPWLHTLFGIAMLSGVLLFLYVLRFGRKPHLFRTEDYFDWSRLGQCRAL